MRNFQIVFLIHGALLAGFAAIALLGAMLSALAFRDGMAGGFIACAVPAGFFGGLLLTLGRGAEPSMTFRSAVLVTAGAWLGLPLFGAIPFMAAPVGLDFTDAVFESISGITTTGSTVMSGLDGEVRSILLWRALLQWIGGIGIIGLSIAILPFLRIGGMQLMNLESSEQSAEKLIARPGALAITISMIYIGLSLACAVGYGMAGMSGFDAFLHAMTTVSTGGYSTSDNSMANFSASAQWVSVVFMLGGAIPFMVYVRAAQGPRAFRPGAFSEVKAFLAIVLGFSLVMVAAQILQSGAGPDTLRLSIFNVVAVITTTGYAVGDYQNWGPLAVAGFFVLTFLGGCAGSTAGGFKTFRLQIMAKSIFRALSQLPSPNSVVIARHGGQKLTDEDVSSVALFAGLYVATFALSSILLAALGLDFVTAITAGATAIANVGPGLGEIIGPAGNFASLPDTAKWVLCFVMILGRLEIITILLLFTPRFYDV